MNRTTCKIIAVLILIVEQRLCNGITTEEPLPTTEKLRLLAPSEFTVTPRLEKAYHTILDIRWKSNIPSLEGASHMIEVMGSNVTTANFDEKANDVFDETSLRYKWTVIFDTEKCCNITYYHIGTWRAARFRIAVKKDESISDYVVSGKVFLPNFHRRTIKLYMGFEEVSRVHLKWRLNCFGTIDYKYRLVYRHANSTAWQYSQELSYRTFHVAIPRKEPAHYIIQMLAYTEHDKIIAVSDPLSYRFRHRTPSDYSRNYLVLNLTDPATVQVDAILDEDFKNKPMRYNLSVKSRNRLVPSKLISFTSDERKFPITVKLSKQSVRYIFKLEFILLEDESKKGVTESIALYTEGAIADRPVDGSISLLKTKSNEFATLKVEWNPDFDWGFIAKIKIRWKYANSPYNIFEEEVCGTYFELKAYSHNTIYQVYVSLNTVGGYTPEKEFNVTVGSPPDWDNYNPDAEEEILETSTVTLPVTHGKPEAVDRHEFEAKLRKEIGHEYKIGFGRLFISISTFVICIIFACVVKAEFLTPRDVRRRVKPRQSKKEGKRRKKSTPRSQESK